MGKDQDVANRVRQEAADERRVPRAYTAQDLEEVREQDRIRRQMNAEKAAEDLVNHPPHYEQGPIKCIDAIEAALTPEEFRGYCKGNVIKYTWRERHKGGDQDLGKTRWYVERLIETLRRK